MHLFVLGQSKDTQNRFSCLEMLIPANVCNRVGLNSPVCVIFVKSSDFIICFCTVLFSDQNDPNIK